MCFGIYPFRCLDCNQRIWVNLWFFSRLAYAKCPKCLSLELTGWPTKRYHLSFRKKLLNTFGAHRYRCPACRYNFFSFRPHAGGKLREAAEEISGTETKA